MQTNITKKVSLSPLLDDHFNKRNLRMACNIVAEQILVDIFTKGFSNLMSEHLPKHGLSRQVMDIAYTNIRATVGKWLLSLAMLGKISPEITKELEQSLITTQALFEITSIAASLESPTFIMKQRGKRFLRLLTYIIEGLIENMSIKVKHFVTSPLLTSKASKIKDAVEILGQSEDGFKMEKIRKMFVDVVKPKRIIGHPYGVYIPLIMAQEIIDHVKNQSYNGYRVPKTYTTFIKHAQVIHVLGLARCGITTEHNSEVELATASIARELLKLNDPYDRWVALREFAAKIGNSSPYLDVSLNCLDKTMASSMLTTDGCKSLGKRRR